MVLLSPADGGGGNSGTARSAHVQQQSRLTTKLVAEDDDLAVGIELEDAMNLALAHNGVSPLRQVTVENRTSQTISGLRLELQIAAVDGIGDVAEPFIVELPPVAGVPEIAFSGANQRWQFNVPTFASLEEAHTTSISMAVYAPGRVLEATSQVRLLARDEWWFGAIPESLAAFVTPRSSSVRELVGEASALLERRTGDPSLQGYQGGSERAEEIARALYDAMVAREIRYINPPPSFEGSGQKIRSPHEVLDGRFGTCLDLATTYAAVLEEAGLHPVLALGEGHAFAGFLADEQQLPEMVTREPGTITTLVDVGLLIPVETVALTAGKGMSFEAARRETSSWWADRRENLVYLIDVVTAHRVVRPLPLVRTEGGIRVVEVESRAAETSSKKSYARPQPVESAPATKGGSRAQQTYPPRVARWRNSLLDLSFRNPLLNAKPGSNAIDLHVPHGSLAALEDMVFAGETLTLLPHDQIAEIHRARGARTAQDIEAEELDRVLRSDKAVFAAVSDGSYLNRLRGPAPQGAHRHGGDRGQQPVPHPWLPDVGGQPPPGNGAALLAARHVACSPRAHVHADHR